jgi:ribosomal protein S18 acetylase RimI-like enzyme
LTTIRTFHESDTEAVIALWHTVFPDDPPHNDPTTVIRQKLAVQRDVFLVALVGDHLVGTTLAGYDGHRGWLYKLAVLPGYRRLGIGTALVRHAEDALRALGCTKVNLQVRATNTGVVAFYKHLGYHVEERISMGKRLPDSSAHHSVQPPSITSSAPVM